VTVSSPLRKLIDGHIGDGIVGGNMPWPLVVVGIFMGIALIMMQVKSPMLVAVGMYLPFETTFAIFLEEFSAPSPIVWPSAAASMPLRWRE